MSAGLILGVRGMQTYMNVHNHANHVFRSARCVTLGHFGQRCLLNKRGLPIDSALMCTRSSMDDTYLVQVVYDVCGACIFVHTCPGVYIGAVL